MQCLRDFLGNAADPTLLCSGLNAEDHSLETTILSQCLHPALKALGLPTSGFHAFRRGCNRRWELAGLNPAVQRQMMGHSSASMTRLYTGETPLTDVTAACSKAFSKQLEVLETEAAA
jgi:integrase